MLFLIYDTQAMEMVIQQKTKFNDKNYCKVALYLDATRNKIDEVEQKKRDEFLARDHEYASGVKKYADAFNFIKNIPQLTFSELKDQTKILNEKNQQIIKCIIQKNIIISLAFSPDVFTTILRNSLPKSYEDHSGFFKPEFNKGVYTKKYDMFGVEQIVNKTLSYDDMVKIIHNKSIFQAFSMFRCITQTGIITLNQRFDMYQKDDSSLSKAQSYREIKYYYFPFQELERMTEQNESILREVVNKSNEGTYFWNIHKRFKFTDDIINSLKPIKDIPENNKLFNSALIITDIPDSTRFEKIVDRVLFGAPLLFVMITPYLVYGKTSGSLSVIKGLIATNLGCFIGGHFVSPIIDSFDSGFRKLLPWFGKNCKGIGRAWDFVMINTAHYLATAVAQKFLSCNSLTLKIIGGGIHILQVLISLLLMYSMEKYDNPFRRSNAKGFPFTFKNLLSGPKFNTINS